MITNKELSYRQSWTLNQKIDHSLYVIDAFLYKYPESVIAFSGGIDSTVMLHLVRMINKNQKAIFANTTNELNEILKFVKDTDNVTVVNPVESFIKIIQREGFPLISKKVARMLHDVRNPTDNNFATRNLYLTGIKSDGTKSSHFIIPKKYRHLIDVDFNITTKCCGILKKKPMKELSENGVFIGTMAENSSVRKGAYLQTGCIDLINHVCKPMSIWFKSDNWKFIKQNNIRYCNVYDKGEINTGCSYCGIGCQFDKCSRYNRMKLREPKRYEIIMNTKNNGVTFRDAIKQTYKIDFENEQKKFLFT